MSEEQELPVAAEVTAVGGMPDEGAAIQNFVQISEGDELVKKGDAEAAIAKERSRKYDEGFFEGRQSREEEILDKLYKQLTNYREKSEDIGLSDREIGACEELRTLQRNFRKDLKEEVEQS